MKKMVFALSLLFLTMACEKSMEPVDVGYTGITETDESGIVIGQTDPDDWGYFSLEDEKKPLYFGNAIELNYDKTITFYVFKLASVCTRNLVLYNHSAKTKYLSFGATRSEGGRYYSKYEYSLEKYSLDLKPGATDTIKITYSVSDTLDLDFPAKGVLNIRDENDVLKTINLSGQFDTIYITGTAVAEKSRFFPAFPNPANQQVKLRFNLQQSSMVSLDIYAPGNIHYQNLVSGYVRKPYNLVTWDVTDVPAGIYCAVLTINDQQVHGDIQVIKD